MVRYVALILIALYALFFIIGGVVAPLMAHQGNHIYADELYYLFSASCQQQPTRTFWLWGYPMAICARCLGSYCGFIAVITYLIKRPNVAVLKPILCLTGVVLTEKTTELILNWSPEPSLRLFFGFFLGATFAFGFHYLIRFFGGVFPWFKLKKLQSF